MKSIPFNTSSYASLSLLAIFLFCSQSALAERCEPQDNNEYEKIFCQLKTSGRGATLPNIYQFRENPPIVQALLLKKPAERAGIIIKMPERNNEETMQRQEELLIKDIAEKSGGPRPLDRSVRTIEVIQQAPSVVAPVVAPPIATTVISVTAASTMTQPEVPAVTNENATAEKNVIINATSAATNAMSGCTLHQLTLECEHGRYQLVGNKTNQQLPANALSDDRKLALPVYGGAPDDLVARDEYLTRAYSRYLSGMIEIGLGASTMSYGKFVNLYKYITDQHLDFVGRFETMYQFLKKEKQDIGVSTRLSLAEGLVVQDCSLLDNMIACDYQKNNYIFVKADSSSVR